MSEILTAIRLVKLYCWERSFSDKVSDVRAQEVKGLRLTAIIKSINQGISLFGPSIVSFLTFSVYIALGNNLTSAIAFTTISLYNVARFPLTMMPLSIKSLAEAKIAYRRLTNFLSQEELVDSREVNLNAKRVSLRVKGSFKWRSRGPVIKLDTKDKKTKKGKKKQKVEVVEDVPELVEQQTGDFTLKNIDVKIKAGELVAVVGSVGCGKSSLLYAALGQMAMIEGKIKVNGSTAYVSQQAWLLSDTVRNNILFGSPYEKERYRKVLEVCQLMPDLDQFPARDQTEIGEKGISLSGGQKQRVALARAVYANKDILLLDDPLSAVDQHVGSALFNNLLKEFIKDKAILFVNNQIQYLSRCDRIIFMKNGVIEGVDTYENLLASNSDFSRMVSEHVSGDTEEQVFEEKKDDIVTEENKEEENKEEQKKSEDEEDENSAEMRKKGKLIIAEDRKMGRLNFSTYGDYAKAGGGFLCFMVLLTFCLTQGSRIVSDWWVSYWIRSTDPTVHSLTYFVGISGGLLGALLISTTLRSVFFAWFTLRAATILHNGVFWKVTRAPMSFFDSTPTGRILNRFSKDQDQIDDLLPDSLLQALQYLLIVLSSLVLVSVLLPWFTLVLVPFFVLFWFFGMYYQRSARELKRMDSITRSPIVEHLSATLQGLSTIRAYHMSEQFERLEVDKINYNSRFFLAFEMSARWLGWRLDFMSTMIVTLTGILVIVLADTISPSTAGLALSYSLQLAGIFQWSVRVAVEAESQMTSVERLMYYTRNIDSEAPQIIEENRPPENWPSNGEITYKDVEVRYKQTGKPALTDLSFDIKQQEKVGIVGRTGAGKSTLGMTLFRILEPTAGSIIIDGIDITTIGLDDLRSKLAIIPQDPVLFIGSIRTNLDPFNQYSDADLWETLEKVHLKKLVEELPGKLESSVSENGENFSVGQRQLLCIGRALVRKPKILVLDEATASIDIETDELIQKTIRQSFANCTVLTVAHRLYTIIDSDKIMVMDKGKLVEFDSPKNLLQSDQISLFAKLIDQSGSQSSRYLRDVALGNASLFDREKAIQAKILNDAKETERKAKSKKDKKKKEKKKREKKIIEICEDDKNIEEKELIHHTNDSESSTDS
jgi:ATP-binding cassette subfamily C (CFTR/MRP) protein 5